jgi:hypothetical protein
MITAKIDVTKIEKARLFKGVKGTYLDIVLIESRDSKYGDDYMVVQSVTKEERLAGVKGPIIGNARILGPKPAAAPAAAPAATKPNPAEADFDEGTGVPF